MAAVMGSEARRDVLASGVVSASSGARICSSEDDGRCRRERHRVTSGSSSTTTTCDRGGTLPLDSASEDAAVVRLSAGDRFLPPNEGDGALLGEPV